jgi:hypothetical protein
MYFLRSEIKYAYEKLAHFDINIKALLVCREYFVEGLFVKVGQDVVQDTDNIKSSVIAFRYFHNWQGVQQHQQLLFFVGEQAGGGGKAAMLFFVGEQAGGGGKAAMLIDTRHRQRPCPKSNRTLSKKLPAKVLFNKIISRWR